MAVGIRSRSVTGDDGAAALAAYMLIPLLLINGIAVPYLVAMHLVVAVVLVTAPEIRRGPWVYLALAASWAPELVMRWFRHEDHVYLGVYWCIAIGLSRLPGRSTKDLQTSARLLIGLCFAFAVLNKLRAPEFISGQLFHYLLLEDVRFRKTIAETVGALSPALVSQNEASLALVNRWDATGTVAVLASTQRIPLLAVAMTVWTFVIETALALVFLASHRRFERWRHALLIAFCLSVYIVAPVIGFGGLFLGMGLTLCRDEQVRTRGLYVAAYLGLLCWTMVRAFVLRAV
jgi:hypothetical protein